MPNNGFAWTQAAEKELITEWQKKPEDVTLTEFAKKLAKHFNRTADGVRGKINELQRGEKVARRYVQESPYPKYSDPLVMEGDALILPDLEFPFHHADFVNRVLSLADAWQIKQVILAGDVLHFDSLSGWEPNWTDHNTGGMTANAETALMEFAKSLPSKQQGKMMELLGDIGQRTEQDGASTELSIARREMRHIADLFDRVDFLLGNHEGRLLRSLETALNPDELLRLTDCNNPKFRIAPYYFSYLDTPRGRYQIEHPKGAAEGTAQGLAAKYGCNIIMGHSHLLDYTWDVSGRYHAIHAGHCVDEARLPYAAQRHTTRRAHKHGAVIVRDGYPWLLHDGIDWQALERMK
jgi:hypothetical protein